MTHTVIIADSEAEVDRMYAPLVEGASLVLIRELDPEVSHLYRVSKPSAARGLITDGHGIGRLLETLR